MMSSDLHRHMAYMQRAIDLAYLAEGTTSPNPQVGSVLVYEDEIIGEGYHQRCGEAHAEVLALRSVIPENKHLIRRSTLYVTLEPCCVFGRTPPCTDLIIQHQIPRVVISAIDRSPGVNHRGIDILRKAGVEVITGILDEQGALLAAQRNTFIASGRPYIFLKYAMSRDGYIGKGLERIQLSNPFSQRLVHRLRRRMDAILIGTGTALSDDPLLTNRHFPGKSPLRLVIDLQGKVSERSRMLRTPTPLWIYRYPQHIPASGGPDHVRFIPVEPSSWSIRFLLSSLSDASITGLLVEGGAAILNSFIREDLWDEALVISCPQYLGGSVSGPLLTGIAEDKVRFYDDEWSWIRNDLSTKQ